MSTTSPPEGLASVLRQAMQVEIDGFHFFTMAAATTKDPRGREVFHDMASQEREHLRYLRRQYASVLETGHTSPEAMPSGAGSAAEPGAIFSKSLR